MNAWFEDFKTYLPKYLSAEAQKNLFAELDQFPSNIDSRVYTIRLQDELVLFQGDGLASMWVADLPNSTINKTRVMVISNTCDTAPDNKRLLGCRLLYCPIISFEKYQDLLQRQKDKLPAGFNPAGHLEAIKRQHNSSMFYLPQSEKLQGAGIALLDRINNCDLQLLDLNELVTNRLFTLSDYGFYLFLFKLSLHLTRIREGVSRN
jgi:hypothetical protein